MQINANRPGYIKTKIGWLPKDWKCTTFGSVFDIQLGKMLSKKAREADGHAPYLANVNVRWGSFDLSDMRTMAFSATEKEKFELRDGDLLVCEGGDIGRCAIWHEEIKPCYYQKALHRLRPKIKSVLPFFAMSFLYKAVRSPRMRGFIGETSIAHFTRERFVSFPIPLPPLPEQEAIAKVLECWDKAIRKYEEKIEKMRNIKKGLMQRLLSGQQRLPGFDGEWKDVRLEEICEIIMGQSPESSAYNETQEGLPLLQGNNDITNGVSSPRFWTSQITRQCLPDDILMTVRAPVGEIALSIHEACIGRGICAIRSNHASQLFVFYLLKHSETIWRSFEQGSTFTAVNSKDVKHFRITIPSATKEQNAIAEVLSSADAEIKVLENKLDLLKDQKRFLLNNMVTGTIRLPQFTKDQK